MLTLSRASDYQKIEVTRQFSEVKCLMHLERFNLTPAQFNAIPDAERALMVLLAHGLNEVNSLEKLVAMSMNFERGHLPIELAQSGQAMILVGILAGKLHEIYRLIEVFF